jgi:hypothetical protein
MAASHNDIKPKPAGKTNYVPWILIGCGTLLVICLIVGALVAVFVWFRLEAPARESRGQRPSIFAGSDVKLVDNHGIQTVSKTWSSCTAYAPADWTIVGNEERVGMGVDLGSSDQTMAASYGIAAVAGGAYYGMSTPEEYIQKMMQTGGVAGFEFDGGSQTINGYTLRYWRGESQGRAVRGFALYMTFDAGDPSTYIISLRLGSTEASKWEERKNLVYDVAASIRCTKHLFPVQQSSASEPKGSSKDQIEEDLSTKRQEAMMGFQNVYSPTTGEHWEASYSDYNPTGPDGPGYYRRVGSVGGYEKLNEGFPPN